jgi:transcription elongation factor
MMHGLPCLQMDGGATPGWAAGETPAVGAAGQKQRSRWDETPAAGSATAGGATPGLGATPAWGGATPAFGVTPVGGLGMETPDVNQLPKVHLTSSRHICIADPHRYLAHRLCCWCCACW